MLYIIVGSSCAGKSSFVKNVFYSSNAKEYKDLTWVIDCDKAYILGKGYDKSVRRSGTDYISRSETHLLLPQIEKLFLLGKDIVCEGDKMVSRPLMNVLIDEFKNSIVLIYIWCSIDKTIERNGKNGYCNKSSITRAHSRALNFYRDYRGIVSSYELNTDNIEDFSKLSWNDLLKVKDLRRLFLY